MLNASEELEERVLVVGELGTRGTPLENAHSLQAPAANAPSTCGHDIRPAHRHLGCEAQSIGRCQAPRGVANLAESRKRHVEAIRRYGAEPARTGNVGMARPHPHQVPLAS